MSADADRPPSRNRPSSLQRTLARRIAIAAVLFAVVGVALIAAQSGGNGANAPATAALPPPATVDSPVSAQSPAFNTRGAEPEPASAAVPTTEPGEPRPTASASPSAGERAGTEEIAAPAAPVSSGTEQGPDRVRSAAPGSARAGPDAGRSESRPLAARADKPEAVEPAQPVITAPEPSAPPAARTQAEGKPARGPRLQAGVFSQPANARALKEKLEANGFAASIEARADTGQSRVYVGPFKDRKEAERAREKLRELGVATVLIAQ